MKKKVALIIDGVSSGAYFAPSLAKKNISCVHISSFILSKEINAENYIENIEYKSFKQVINRLKKYKILFILPACDTAITLADKLKKEFNLFPNEDHELSESRHNKYKMLQAIKNANITTPKFIASNNINEIISWYVSAKLK